MKKIIVILVLVIACTRILSTTSPDDEPLLTVDNLVYKGIFKVPTGTHGASTFDSGGAALSYNPDHNSLYLSGNTALNMYLGEISIPAELPCYSSLSDCNTATVLQDIVDPSEGTECQVGYGGSCGTTHIIIGGSLRYSDGNLYFSGYPYYDGNPQDKAWFRRSPNLTTPSVTGPFNLYGTLGGALEAGFMALIPSEWQTRLGGPTIVGLCCITNIARTSFGPDAFTIDPTTIGPTDEGGYGLLYYPSTHPLDNASQTTLFGVDSTQINGAIFPGGTRSLLYFGQQGLGIQCYGDVPADCTDPVVSSRGGHAYPYEAYIWGIDALDLEKVKNGMMNSYDVRPYAVWGYSLPWDSGYKFLGVAINGNTIYAATTSSSGNVIIHVFQITYGTGLFSKWWNRI